MNAIQIDTTLSYQLNPPGGEVRKIGGPLAQLFSPGNAAYPQEGYGNKVLTKDEYYVPLNGYINLQQVQLVSGGQGAGKYPFTLSAIDKSGKETTIATFTGAEKGTTTYPVTIPNVVKFHIVTTSDSTGGTTWPVDCNVFGDDFTKPVPYYQLPVNPLKVHIGFNAFLWDLLKGDNSGNFIDGRVALFSQFHNIRWYIDHSLLEGKQGSNTFSPTHSGGWFIGNALAALPSVTHLFDFKIQPDWMKSTWPAAQQNNQNWPVMYGKDPADPMSYKERSRAAFQIAAWGGQTVVPASQLTVDTSIRWNGDIPNKVVSGLGILKCIENNNENDRWWQGRNAYQTAHEYAADMSAFYDGHQGKLGAGFGVKKADPKMNVVIGGICGVVPDYFQGMVDWCNTNRKGSLCWDTFNVHAYALTKQPEGELDVQLLPLVRVARQYKKRIWLTETGYDVTQGGPNAAPAIGSKTPLLVQADWILRTVLLAARIGIDRTFIYNAYDIYPNNGTAYGTSGLLDASTKTGCKPSGDYLLQLGKLMGNYKFVQSSISLGLTTDIYSNGTRTMYVVFSPTSNGASRTYTMPGKGSIYTPVAGGTAMKKITGSSFIASETPTFYQIS